MIDLTGLNRRHLALPYGFLKIDRITMDVIVTVTQSRFEFDRGKPSEQDRSDALTNGSLLRIFLEPWVQPEPLTGDPQRTSGIVFALPDWTATLKPKGEPTPDKTCPETSDFSSGVSKYPQTAHTEGAVGLLASQGDVGISSRARRPRRSADSS